MEQSFIRHLTFYKLCDLHLNTRTIFLDGSLNNLVKILNSGSQMIDVLVDVSILYC